VARGVARGVADVEVGSSGRMKKNIMCGITSILQRISLNNEVSVLVLVHGIITK